MFKKLIWPLRILFFLFFFISAFAKVFPNPDVAIHLFEKEQLMSLGIPLCLSTWLSRALIALEFTLALGFLVPYFFKRITLTLSTILLLFFTLFLCFEVFVMGKWTGNCGCFGQLIPMTPPVSLLKNIVALVLLGLIFWKREEIKEEQNPSIGFFVGTYLALFALIYVISPQTCWCAAEQPNKQEVGSVSLSQEVEMLKDKFPSLPQGKAILCFYSPTCSHCMETAKALQELKQRTGIEKHHVVFMIEGDDTEKKIKNFLNTTKLDAEYTTMEFIDFPTEGADPPAILLINNGKVISRFFGNDKNKFEKSLFLKEFNELKH